MVRNFKIFSLLCLRIAPFIPIDFGIDFPQISNVTETTHCVEHNPTFYHIIDCPFVVSMTRLMLARPNGRDMAYQAFHRTWHCCIEYLHRIYLPLLLKIPSVYNARAKYQMYLFVVITSWFFVRSFIWVGVTRISIHSAIFTDVLSRTKRKKQPR